MRPNATKALTELSPPPDLSSWASKRALIQFALNAVQNVDLCLETPEARHTEYRPQMMLTLLTYSYACGIYGSQDVEWATEHDALARYICARTFPDWRTIRRFRRQNHPEIRRCLTQVIKDAWALKLRLTDGTPVDPDWIEAVLAERVEASVQSRLESAAIMDRMAFEV